MEAQIRADEFLLANFRSERYAHLNRLRWDAALSTGLQLSGKTIFEPGAGIGDQTQWLLAQGAAKVIVNDGRRENLEFIRRRFAEEPRVSLLLGDLEKCLDEPEFQIKADIVFLWGVYYHINDDMEKWNIMRQLARIAPVVIFDYLESAEAGDWIENYGYDNPSTSISRKSGRPRRHTMVDGLKQSFGFAYFPTQQMDWVDPLARNAPRRIAVGSRGPLNLNGVINA